MEPKPVKPKIFWPSPTEKPRPLTAAEKEIYSTSLGFQVNQPEDLEDPRKPNPKRRR